MRELLNKDEFKRLGSRAGASDVKSHSFFKGTNWALLRNQTPPIIPKIRKDPKLDPLGLGLLNFRSLKESVALDFSKETLLDDPSSVSNPFHAFETFSITRTDE